MPDEHALIGRMTTFGAEPPGGAEEGAPQDDQGADDPPAGDT